MSNYGPNFEFRVPPRGPSRNGRFAVPTTGTRIPIGAPVAVDEADGENSMGMQIVKLAAADLARGAGKQKGIVVYEYGPAAFAGDDPMLTTYSDKDLVPLGAAVQVIFGDLNTKVVLRNTEDRTFLQTREYTGRVFVAGLGATPTLTPGDFLIPGAGDDDDGYWKETATEADAWLVVEKVDTARSEVEARMLF